VKRYELKQYFKYLVYAGMTRNWMHHGQKFGWSKQPAANHTGLRLAIRVSIAFLSTLGEGEKAH
jgi:hypothetical protein